jgi:hypothetical protein
MPIRAHDRIIVVMSIYPQERRRSGYGVDHTTISICRGGSEKSKSTPDESHTLLGYLIILDYAVLYTFYEEAPSIDGASVDVNGRSSRFTTFQYAYTHRFPANVFRAHRHLRLSLTNQTPKWRHDPQFSFIRDTGFSLSPHGTVLPLRGLSIDHGRIG